MTIPLALQTHLDQTLNSIKAHPSHLYPYYDRLQLYRDFLAALAAPVEVERLFLGRLAIATAKRVVPIWLADDKVEHLEGDDFCSYEPEEMLKRAEEYLENKIEREDVLLEVNGKFDTGLTAVENGGDDKIFCVVLSAYEALRTTLFGLEHFYVPKNENEFSDSSIKFGKEDFARFAEVAIALINPDNRKTRNLRMFYPDNCPPLLFDNEKRLAFWEWWLTEAIPQAWELAEQAQ